MLSRCSLALHNGSQGGAERGVLAGIKATQLEAGIMALPNWKADPKLFDP